MNIGVFFKHRESGGGIYQYFLTLLDALRDARSAHQVYVFYRWVVPPLHCTSIRPVRLVPENDRPEYPGPGVSPIANEVSWNGRVIRFQAQPLSKELLSASITHGIDVMLYPTPEREAFEAGIPYVMAVHDVGHRILPHFPEFTENGILEQREYVYTEGIRKASIVLVDSETGKEQLRVCYGAPEEKIVLLPFIPPYYLFETPPKEPEEARKGRKKELPERFLFYPAQLWPHKNHTALIEGLALIKRRKNLAIPVVLTGGNDPLGCLPKLRQLARDLEVSDLIHCMGYVEPSSMRDLYEKALALVMPTFLGPTNIPILEAFATGCPVITSDIPGARELAGNAALLVDPESPEEIADSILRIWADEPLREILKERGKERIAGRTREAFSSRLMRVLDALETDLQGTQPEFPPR